MVFFRRQRDTTWEAIRRRIISETEWYLETCLRAPAITVAIPAIRVGEGCFTRQFAQAFWERQLDL